MSTLRGSSENITRDVGAAARIIDRSRPGISLSPVSIVGQGSDVAAREPGLRTLLAVLDGLPVFSMLTDAFARVVYVSPGFSNFSRKLVAAGCGLGQALRFHHDDEAGVVAQWREAGARARAFEGEFRLLDAHGESRWFRTSCNGGAHDVGGRPHWLYVLTDVDELVRAQKAQAESESRLRLSLRESRKTAQHWRDAQSGAS